MMEDVYNKLGFCDLNDWYQVTVRDFASFDGGSGLLKKYNNSLADALHTVYPNHTWDSRFFRPKKKSASKKRKVNKYWKKSSSIISFVMKAEERLNITSLEAWTRVSVQQLSAVGGGGLISYFPDILPMVYPDYCWRYITSVPKRSEQRWLAQCAKRCFKSLPPPMQLSI
mmetsp:Transcript_1671/g.1855  ORF Transcript_1671/g.1855 Transcript_1671/m.1855 type:complete len:170 (-) Transcript_1671:79-588(-)